MKVLGRLSHFTKTGNLVLVGEQVPRLYSLVGTKDKKIGKVQDVIGPSSRPYIVVKPSARPNEKDLAYLRKETFYELPREERRKPFGKASGVHRELPRMQK